MLKNNWSQSDHNKRLYQIINKTLNVNAKHLAQWFPNFFGSRTTQKIWWSAKDKLLNYIGIRGPLQLISRTTSGPRSRLCESLSQQVSVDLKLNFASNLKMQVKKLCLPLYSRSKQASPSEIDPQFSRTFFGCNATQRRSSQYKVFKSDKVGYFLQVCF